MHGNERYGACFDESDTLASNDFGNPKSIPLVRGNPLKPLKKYEKMEVKNMRKRNHQINVRLDENELKKLEKKVAKSGLTRAASHQISHRRWTFG